MIDPEKKLWQSVLLTAVQDALMPRKHKSIYSYKIAEDAKEWLLNNNSHYFRVCSMADINPLALRAKVKDVLSCEDSGLSTIDETNILGQISENINSSES